MNLFKRHKVKKVLEEYLKQAAVQIPETSIGYDELVRLRDLNLEELAIAYDTLKGWEYFREPMDGVALDLRYHMPAKSRYVPCKDILVEEPSNNLVGLVRQLKNKRVASEYVKKVDWKDTSVRYVHDNGAVWK